MTGREAGTGRSPVSNARGGSGVFSAISFFGIFKKNRFAAFPGAERTCNRSAQDEKYIR